MANPRPSADPADIQRLLQAFNARQLAQAEAMARRLLATHPATGPAHSVLAALLAQQGQREAALPHFSAAARLQPGTAELHFNLALCLSGLGRHPEAVTAYRTAIGLKPDFAVAHFSLGAALQAIDALADATAHYRSAVQLQPGYLEAWGNLGAVLQLQGQLDAAIDAYQRALAIRPHPRLQLSLGSALRNRGDLDAAVTAYRKAVELDPAYAEAHDRLGSALWARGDPEAAVASYGRALELQPELPEARYNLGVFLQDAGRHAEAIPHFRAAGIGDAHDRALYCAYRSGDFAAFRSGLEARLHDAHRSPLLATLTAHHALNFGQPDPYRFCPRPLEFIHHAAIPPLAEARSTLLAALLRDIQLTGISERKQGRLHEGIQSSGNLFRRSEASFRELAALVLAEVRRYPAALRDLPGAATCELLAAWPADPEFSSSWYLRMRQGGHLTSHIHEEGWISGCVYLAMPPVPAGALDGSIEFSLDGDDYPRRHDNFPSRTITPAVGDIVLFPSSLFHRTIPFAAATERICVAFDILPAHA
ncbi:MAG: tetratricopeptide repeat protein [Pseudomonadota bacterium]|nr:tetratricopeptide repeat protein [Pseudomonadota bacterium]